MKTWRIARLMLAALAVLGLSTFAFADAWNQKTKITINETIDVPGATLAPGTYVVKLVDSMTSRHIVRFMNADETKTLTTVLAIPNQRQRPTGDSQFSFYEMPIGNHPALRSWFYPGRLIGQQFVYPKARAMEIANATGMYVPSMSEDANKYMSDQSDDDAYLNAYRETEVNAYGKDNQSTTYEESVARNQNIKPTTPARSHEDWMEFENDNTANTNTNTTAANRPTVRQDSQVLAQNRTPSRDMNQDRNQYSASNELPRTASNMPLLLLLATLLIGGGFAIRRFA